MSTDKHVVIVIGRSQESGSGPAAHLDTEEWGDFRAYIIEFLARHGTFFNCFLGVGLGTAGVEENATILGTVEEQYMEKLRDYLLALRHDFDQSIIWLTIGDSEAISA